MTTVRPHLRHILASEGFISQITFITPIKTTCVWLSNGLYLTRLVYIRRCGARTNKIQQHQSLCIVLCADGQHIAITEPISQNKPNQTYRMKEVGVRDLPEMIVFVQNVEYCVRPFWLAPLPICLQEGDGSIEGFLSVTLSQNHGICLSINLPHALTHTSHLTVPT